MKKDLIKISDDFSTRPGPRYKIEGPNSGEQFRTEILSKSIQKAIREDFTLVVDLDDTEGYGTSFLEEAFGGLIRHEGQKRDDVLAHLHIVSEDEEYLINDIVSYIKNARCEN